MLSWLLCLLQVLHKHKAGLLFTVCTLFPVTVFGSSV
ncbi:hypothetical protein E2320_022888 [Naja naja]|nr:hypothetical protein E2320_022888 [Naja naja]